MRSVKNRAVDFFWNVGHFHKVWRDRGQINMYSGQPFPTWACGSLCFGQLRRHQIDKS